jgi:hypothetical protein
MNTTGQKFGGRQKGSLNVVKSEIRDMFKDLLENNLDKLQNDLDQLQPFERVKMLFELARFVIPTLKQTELTLEGQQPIITLNLGNGVKPPEDTIL